MASRRRVFVLAVLASIIVVGALVTAIYYLSLLQVTTPTSVSSPSSSISTSCQIQATQVFIPTLADLKNDVQAIVVGKVTGFPNMTFPGNQVSTVFTVFVNQTLKGDIANDSLILVSQLGRRDCPAAHDPLMSVGDQTVLFLYKVPSSSAWGIFAGQQGRFLVQNGMVNSLDVIYPAVASPTIHVQDVPLDQFIARVKSA